MIRFTTLTANKHHIMVLEDACQADGGSFHGKRLGTIGTAGALSFNYYKVISSGEGGALLTNDKTKALSPYCTIVTSNDPEGDCATTLAIRFDSEEETRAFAVHSIR